MKINKEQATILSALATLIETCETNIALPGGCGRCPLRNDNDKQLEGYGECAFESATPPSSWILKDPTEQTSPVVLIDTDPYYEMADVWEDESCPL